MDTLIIGLVVGLAFAGVIVVFLLYGGSPLGERLGLFQPRFRRLDFIERLQLDGGRKLLLVRRDDVEHLVMIGGPIDLVVENNIKSAPAPTDLIDEKDAAQQTLNLYPQGRFRDAAEVSREIRAGLSGGKPQSEAKEKDKATPLTLDATRETKAGR
jgi:flagellar protein FliO/FliZ